MGVYEDLLNRVSSMWTAVLPDPSPPPLTFSDSSLWSQPGPDTGLPEDTSPWLRWATEPTNNIFGGRTDLVGQLLRQTQWSPAKQAKLNYGLPATPKTPSPTWPNQASASGSYSATTALEKAIDRYSAGDSDLALSMRMGVLMEGGNFEGGWGVGDSGQSYGPYQIYQGAGHQWDKDRPVTVEDSLDPDRSTAYMVGQYRTGVERVRKENPNLFKTDPYRAAALAAFYSERPAAMYPTQRQGWGAAELEKRKQAQAQAQPSSAAVSVNPGWTTRAETPDQFNSGLSTTDAMSACGPAAAIAFARAQGRNPTMQEALEIAKTVGWTPQAGMAGPQSQVNLLKQMGVASTLEQGVNWSRVQQEVSAGRPVIIDTPGHYFVVEGYDPATGKYNFGNSGRALKSSRGQTWFTAQEMAALGAGAARSSIYLS